jgi:DNA-binding NarL/FixJ family response regulator
MRILVLTTFDDDEYVWQSLSAGALGYLLKKTPSQHIVAAIRSVFQGYSQLGPTIAPKVFSQIKPSARQKLDVGDLLSKCEIEVLKLVGRGNHNQEIARSLHLSEGTVKNYLTQIFGKLGARDRIQAVLWAQKNLL